MKISSWGNYFITSCNKIKEKDFGHGVTPVGNQCSYNNINANKKVVFCKNKKFEIEDFGKDKFLKCSTAYSLKEVIDRIKKEDCFLPVVPGTKNISIGGAIASNVHGKNHHIDGSFCDHVEEITVKLRTGEIKKISKNDDAFYDFCGCFGITGLILEARIKLLKLNGSNCFTVKKRISSSLKDSIYLLDKNNNDAYNVCWINTTPKSKENIGEGVYMAGNFANDEIIKENKRRIKIPMLPSWALNNFSLTFLNRIHFFSEKMKVAKKKNAKEDFDTFLFPLDAYSNWDNAYGKKGMMQFQFVTSSNKETSVILLEKVLTLIYERKAVSFITVLKKFGNKRQSCFFNKGLNFQIEDGYTLAMDFPGSNRNLLLMKEIAKLVEQYNGNIYLAKNINSDTISKIVNSQQRKNWFIHANKKYKLERGDYPDFFRKKINFMENIIVIGANSTIVQKMLLETELFNNANLLLTTSTGKINNFDKIKQKFKNCKIETMKVNLLSTKDLEDSVFHYYLKKADFLLLGSGVLDKKESIKNVFKINQEASINIIEAFINNKTFFKKNICFLSSVTTMRGKKSTLAYSASKRAVEMFLEGLEFDENVDVYIPRLGFVETKMTEGMKLPKLLTKTPSAVAKTITNNILNKKTGIKTLSKRWIIVEAILKRLPKNIWKKIDER